MPLSLNFSAFEKSIEDHLRQQEQEKRSVEEESPVVWEMDRSNNVTDLFARFLAERIRREEDQRRREMQSSVFAVTTFRVPTAMVNTLLGVRDQRVLEVAYRTGTEFVLPRHSQGPVFTISGYIHNIRKALRIIEKIVNDECRLPQSSPYTFIVDPNQDQSGTDYILCNGPIHEVRYKPEREGMRMG